MTLLDRAEAPAPRNRGLAVSLALHAAAFWGLMEAPRVEIPRETPSEYKQAFAGNEQKLVWYRFKKELPAVRPAKTADKRPPRADVNSAQTIVSSVEAPRRAQTVLIPAPELAAVPPPESPNLIAVKLPDPVRKAFTAPPDVVRKPAEVAMEAPPEIETKALQKQTTRELETRRNARRARIDADAPEIETRALRRQIARELEPQRIARRAARLEDAPEVGAADGRQTAALPISKLPARAFAGAAPARSGSARAPQQVDGANADVDAVIVGLHPVEMAVALPSASNPASFAAGPRLREGSTAEKGAPGIVAPGLFVKGPVEKNSTDLRAQVFRPPTGQETLAAVVRRGEPVHVEAPAATTSNGATRVSTAPDPRMNGRDVYMMAIQMPNLTSYSGSWLMWYASKTAREAAGAPIAPPVAHRKVDPKYAQDAVQQRIEGNVQLACEVDREGKVSKVQLIRGVDERLNQSAAEALAKWEFYPATRNGEPVAVDVVVEIPFRVAPRPFRR